jgi:capsular polysaccharide biosynthesis protein
MVKIKIRAVEEATLPAYSSPARLCRLLPRRGRSVLLPTLSKRVSELSSCRFDRAGHPVPEWWQDDPVIPGRPVEMYRLSNAFVFPGRGAVVSSGGDAMQASTEELRFSSPDRSLAHLARATVSDGNVAFDCPAALPRLRRAIVTLPSGAVANYGHFILDCLGGVAATMGVPELAGYPYVFPPLAPWQRRHLELLGVSSPTILTGDVYRAARTIYTNCMAHNLHAPNLHFLTVRDRQLSNLASHESPNFSERLYLSRRGHMRVFRDEPELEARLAASGFAVVQPELHSVDQQIRMFRRAKIIVGPTGAAFANVLYCQPGAQVVEIAPRQMADRWVGWLCALTGARWRPYFCEGQSENASAPHHDVTFGVDIADFTRHLFRGAA